MITVLSGSLPAVASRLRHPQIPNTARSCPFSSAKLLNTGPSICVEHRQRSPKRSVHPDYYLDVIERHNDSIAKIQNSYANAAEDNLSCIKSNFIIYKQVLRQWDQEKLALSDPGLFPGDYTGIPEAHPSRG
ncbi:hypothetical protein VTL71DRAFT_13722 [Oculimacula yallundae]|uniref:Uncharacterized protein n=1 Tax=Oculimacula yallundae TaxID=86028 RepID=A0ABR4CNB6_9HELO